MSRERIVAAVKAIYQKGDVIEIRTFGSDKFIGRFPYGMKLINAIVTADEELGFDVYICLNPTTLESTFKLGSDVGTKKEDVIYRRWFLLDGDPIRDFIRDESGEPIKYPVIDKKTGLQVIKDGVPLTTTKRHKIATDAEWQAAFEAMTKARAWLLSRGWAENEVIIASSGNGVHLLVRCDLPNTPEAEHLIKATQRAVAGLFSSDQVEIECFSDADRIVRAYGTRNMKGTETAERKHRWSGLL